MLLAAIDERHRGTYNFIYLPIDFKVNAKLLYKFPLILLMRIWDMGRTGFAELFMPWTFLAEQM
jgi:hypothetical protein